MSSNLATASVIGMKHHTFGLLKAIQVHRITKCVLDEVKCFAGVLCSRICIPPQIATDTLGVLVSLL